MPIAAICERRGFPTKIDEAGQSAIGFDRNVEMLTAPQALQLPLTREIFALRTDSDLAQLAALRAGFGTGAAVSV